VSTSETDEFVVAACPCAKGQVIRTVFSYDNPWSGADVSYRIECEKCRNEWDLSPSGNTLTLRSSLSPWFSADKLQTQARQKTAEYLRILASHHFSKQTFPSKKAEHGWMVSSGLFRGSYQSYLAARKVRSVYEIVALDPESAFVAQLVNEYGDPRVFDNLRAAEAAAQAATKEASAHIVRRKIA
jgi:hypothetical protein